MVSEEKITEFAGSDLSLCYTRSSFVYQLHCMCCWKRKLEITQEFTTNFSSFSVFSNEVVWHFSDQN